MDFDEYDYLERTVENPEPEKARDSANGGDGALKSGDKDRDRRSKHRSDEKDGGKDGDRRSKRSRSGDESRDQERRREGRSSHPRSRSKDGERDRDGHSQERGVKDRDVDRGERNGKDRDKDRERREREHLPEKRDRDSEREKEKERSRRSSSRSDRPRSERDEREGEREGERDRVGEREFRGRGPRENRKKREDGTEPEADPERDQRTVFAYQLSLKADERDVYEFFSRAGKVRDVRLIMDRNSRRSKGVGYIEFYDVMSVPMAIALSGQPLLGAPVMVKPSEAEKNLVQSTSAAAAVSGAGGPYSGGARRMYVGNLHVNITEDQLRQVFEAFGQVELVQLPLDEIGNCKGFGFVQFARLEDARNALSLNGQLELAGRTIKVSTVTDPTGVQEAFMNPTDLDDDDGGLSLNASTRALLIQRLARSDSTASAGSPTVPGVGSGVTMPTAPFLGTQPLVPGVVPLVQSAFPMLPGFPATAAVSSLDTVGVPSECLLLKNMFDPKLETEPDFELDIKEDVQEECSKYGNLKHIHVDKNSAGFVYLRFETTNSAMGAQRALHGRWFAGKMITATYMVPVAYEEKFPESR